MTKEKGKIYFSKKIKERVDKNSSYFLELYSILDDMSQSQKIEPLSVNYPSEKDKKFHVIVQYPSSSGRIYVETTSDKRENNLLFLKSPYLLTNIYIYTATEYEHCKEETEMFPLEKMKLSESEVL